MRRISVCLILFLFPALLFAHTFYVTNSKDDGNEGSFRWAVEMCDWYPQTCDTVLFAIPERDPGYDPEIGVWTIWCEMVYGLDDYEFRNNCAVIDGFSQREFIGRDTNPFGPEIEIRGDPEYHGTGIRVIGDDVTIKGICISGFADHTIKIHGWPPGEISENAVITGCYINTDPTGTERRSGCVTGIDGHADAVNFRIGGYSPEERNIISGASNELDLHHCGVFQVLNNYIGTDRTGTVDLNLKRSINVYIGHLMSSAGSSVFSDNVVASAHWASIHMIDVKCDSGGIRFEGNMIGLGIDGTPMGADWDVVNIMTSYGHLFRQNIIAYAQGWNGMELSGGTTDSVTISQNSIFGCNRLGINLSNYPYETLQLVDLVDGVYLGDVNEGIDPCLCDSVISVDGPEGGSTTVYFTCMPECVVEVFIGDTLGWNPRCSREGYGRVYSGYTYLGDAEEIDPGPIWSQYRYSHSPGLPEGTFLISTATNRNGSTSEFGCSCEVSLSAENRVNCLPAEIRLLPPYPNPCTGRTAIRYHLPDACHVRISIYDISGRLSALIVDEFQDPGIHGIWWQAEDRGGESLPAGTYVIRMVTDRFVASEKVVLLP